MGAGAKLVRRKNKKRFDPLFYIILLLFFFFHKSHEENRDEEKSKERGEDKAKNDSTTQRAPEFIGKSNGDDAKNCADGSDEDGF